MSSAPCIIRSAVTAESQIAARQLDGLLSGMNDTQLEAAEAEAQAVAKTAPAAAGHVADTSARAAAGEGSSVEPYDGETAASQMAPQAVGSVAKSVRLRQANDRHARASDTGAVQGLFFDDCRISASQEAALARATGASRHAGGHGVPYLTPAPHLIRQAGPTLQPRPTRSAPRRRPRCGCRAGGRSRSPRRRRPPKRPMRMYRSSQAHR